MDSFATREFYTVVVGGAILAHIAGYINGVSLSGVYALPVSHMTGTVTKVGIMLLKGDFSNFALFGGLVLAFMFGAFTSGFMLGNAKFRLGRGYGVALIFEAIALFVSYALLNWDMALGEIVAAYACGLQNAMASSYSGAVLRTTHMTGICTDIAIVLGQAASRKGKAETWKLKVLVPLLVSYLTGGMTGWLCYMEMGHSSMLVPGFLLLGVAFFYLTWEPAREAREVLTQAVNKLHTEIEMGIRTIATPIVDLRKNLHSSQQLHQPLRQQDEILRSATPAHDPLAQARRNEAIEQEIDKLFAEMGMQRRADNASEHGESQPLRQAAEMTTTTTTTSTPPTVSGAPKSPDDEDLPMLGAAAASDRRS
ncbi:hypothetical protein RI367_001525 [Sorochytrium milnesiophthora]